MKRFELWQLLQQDTVLLELVKTPLLLSITVLSYEELSLQRWQQLTSTKQRIKMLLDAYVQKMFRREMESRAYKKLPPRERQTRYWLIFLTQQLQRESQTEFLIEKIQPSWLVTSRQKKVHQWVAGLIFGLIGLIFGLFDKRREQEIKLFETFKWNWSFKKAKEPLVRGLFFGLSSGLIGGLFFRLSGLSGLSGLLLNILLYVSLSI